MARLSEAIKGIRSFQKFWEVAQTPGNSQIVAAAQGKSGGGSSEDAGRQAQAALDNAPPHVGMEKRPLVWPKGRSRVHWCGAGRTSGCHGQEARRNGMCAGAMAKKLCAQPQLWQKRAENAGFLVRLPGPWGCMAAPQSKGPVGGGGCSRGGRVRAAYATALQNPVPTSTHEPPGGQAPDAAYGPCERHVGQAVRRGGFQATPRAQRVHIAGLARPLTRCGNVTRAFWQAGPGGGDIFCRLASPCG